MHENTHFSQWFVLHKDRNEQSSAINTALKEPALAQLTITELLANTAIPHADIYLPNAWAEHLFGKQQSVRHYESLKYMNNIGQDNSNRHSDWTVISNASFATRLDYRWLARILEQLNVDVAAVNVNPDLATYSENIKLTSTGSVAGFRRHYSDTALLSTLPAKWPHHLFIRKNVMRNHLTPMPDMNKFDDFIRHCHSHNIIPRAITLPGDMLDLNTENGLVTFYKAALTTSKIKQRRSDHRYSYGTKFNCENTSIAPNAKLFGTVIIGDSVTIEDYAIVLGPAILSSNVTIAHGAVLKTSVVPPNCCIRPETVTNDRILISGFLPDASSNNNIIHSVDPFRKSTPAPNPDHQETYKSWPAMAYPRWPKRILDILASAMILILTLPIIAVVAIAVKMESKGPVFFSHKRQGIHGRIFNCLKFRTMIIDADNMQTLLRTINQVDGPQFKIDKDPRITKLGKFLRSSYIDEIPQLFNVLLGQMSMIGPRPSPSKENLLCPTWHDARLSVRPGITGLWQISRTRRANQDFQEWLHYDTQYVKNISLKLDIVIFFKTLKKFILTVIGSIYSPAKRKEI